MAKFTGEEAASVAALQQLIAEWCHELDVNNGNAITRLLTDDCRYMLGGKAFESHAAIDGFYAARNERVRTQQKDGVRTQRHSVSNFRTSFAGPDAATVHYTLVNYSHEGNKPAPLLGPTILAEVTMGFRRGADGEWLISLFDSEPVFVGNDPFLNASVMKK